MFEWLGAPTISACWPDVDVAKYRGAVALLRALEPGKTPWVAQVFKWVGGNRWSLLNTGTGLTAQDWLAYQAKYKQQGAVIYRWDSPLQNNPTNPPAEGGGVRWFVSSDVSLRDCSVPDDVVRGDTDVPVVPAGTETKKDNTVLYVVGAVAGATVLYFIFK